MPFAHTTEAVRAWVHGWSASRGAAEPVPSAWGFTIDVGLHGHVMRHVLHSADEAIVRELTRDATAPGVWLKAFVAPETLEPWLAPGWHLAGGPGFLMSAALPAAPVRGPGHVAEGYEMTTWTRGGVTRALVRRSADGAFAARGQIAVTGHTAVVDQVETDPAHQRRGLGRLVMRELMEAGRAQGAAACVLGATPEGRALYEATGWRVLAPLTSALRGPDPVGA
ncbi:GNAT family N-acetyltransferase [Streptomyces vinaceus]|uniref:GNAT family N-acetyltransferase n=1 Tax=Streptomyces vinaceus TaxID=1960 RepID=UPI0035D7B434